MKKKLILLFVGWFSLWFISTKTVNAACVPDQCQNGCNSNEHCQASCCVTNGGGGPGPTPTNAPGFTPTCFAGEYVQEYVPTWQTCQSIGGCRLQSDGTGGEAGVPQTHECTQAGVTKHLCNRGRCVPLCECTQSPGECGNTTNGCPYEQQIQIMSCSTPGCQPNTCAANLACPWPGSVTGRKVRMPGNITGVAGIANQTVTLDALSSAADPFNFNLADTNSGATHTAKVPLNAAYDIGYSLCYNTTNCHSGLITPGNIVAISDDGIRANGNMFANPYASLYWHYCPVLSVAQNLNPNVQACVPSGSTVSTTMTWSAPASGTASSYNVTLIDNSIGTTVVNTTTTGTSQAGTITVGHNYTMSVRPVNACGGTGAWASVNFLAVNPPTPPGNLTVTDIGGSVILSWPNSTNGQNFLVKRNASTIATLAPTAHSYPDPACATYSYQVVAQDLTKPAGCQQNPSNTVVFTCDANNSSWFSASGGGNLVAGNGTVRSQVPSTVFNPYLNLNAEGRFPGLGIGNAFQNVDASNVNSLGWLYKITTPGWGATGSNILADRENSYDGMHDRIWARVTPGNISVYGNIDNTNIALVYGLGSTLGSTGVKVVTWNGSGTLNIGPVDMSGKKLLIFSEGNINLLGDGGSPSSRSVYWTSANPGFLAVIARGDISVDPNVGVSGLTMDVDVRPDDAADANYVAPHIQGIYYAGGTFSTGTVGGATRDKILKVDGTVIGMVGVSLQRINVGRYPVEFFNFKPDLINQLSEVGLRRKIVQELLNP